MNGMATVRSVTLERIKLVVIAYLSGELADELAGQPDVQVSDLMEFFSDEIAVRVRYCIWGENVGTLEVETPSDWWQMLKEQHAPAWFTRRWPVRYSVRTFKAQALYPKVSLQNQPYVYHWAERTEEVMG